MVDAGVRKQLDLQVIVPIDDMGELGRPVFREGEPVLNGPAAGEPEVRHSIWPAIQAELLELIRQHQSTLIFVNSRRLAERLATRLNELAGEELVRAHHGSIAREQRLDIEDALKAGRLPALVATSSLELGIDMGAIDLVVQVEAPTSVASGLQRIGRAGHQVGEPSKGRVFPKFRGDLIMAAVTSQRMRDGLIESTVVPRNPLDVLAQQIVAMVAMDTMTVEEVEAIALGAYPFAELTRELLENVLDMLSGRYPSDEFAELRPRITWDRVEGTLEARPGARMLAVTSGGTIPDRGLFGVFTPEGSRVGELDEECVYESRVGETMILGATTWRIEEITRERVVVTPAPGEPGKMPFWHGDQLGRPYELGQAVGQFLREIDDWSNDRLRDECALDEKAIVNLRSYIAEEREYTQGALPTDRQLVIERFRDELGDWRICVLSPFGARVHAPWALAIEARISQQLDVEVQCIWSDDGIVVRLPEADEPPPVDIVLVDPDEVEELVVNQVGNSALFASRFRENAARALLLPRRRPGSRTPLWQMRQRAADLLSVATKYGSFPILLETYRECLRDVFDLPGLVSLMKDVQSRAVRVAAVDTAQPSPFATSLAFVYVAQFMYEYDAPVAERRAQALTLDRRMLAELVGADELRELIDPDALSGLEAELQCLDEDRWATSIDGAHDLLRRLGDLTHIELRARASEDFSRVLVSGRRAIEVRVAGEARLIAIEDAARYRDGVGAVVPHGVPDAFLEPVPDAATQLLRRWARTHGPFLAAEPAARFGFPIERVELVLTELAADGTLLLGAFRPGGVEREWCDAEVLRRLRQRSLAALRREVEPTDAEALTRFLPRWHGIDGEARGLDRLYEVISQLQGVGLPASVLERDVLSIRVRDYSPRLLDDLLAAGEVMWVGAGSLGRDDGKVRLFLRDQAPLLLPRLAGSGEKPDSPEHERLREILGTRGACFFRDLQVSDERLALDALWDLVWAGEVTNDSFAAVRALSVKKRTGGAARGGRPRLSSLTALGPPTAQGRWALVDVGTADPTQSRHAMAGVLLDRHGVLTRQSARAEGVMGGFAAVYPVLRAMEEAGRIRRGYFVAGLGGAQFALPGAVDRLRAVREPTDERPLVLAATDPANPYGISVDWPAPNLQRAAGAYVVLAGGVASLYVEKGGRGLVALRLFDGTWEAAAVEALKQLLGEGRFRRISVERVDPALDPFLREAGFVPTPKGLVLYA